MKKVRVGIVGLGLAGYQLHAKAYTQIEGAEIYALCTRNQQKLENIAGELNVGNIYTDYREMLKDPGLEAVSICVADSLHYQFSRMAVESGKHVLCEKPLAISLDEARKLVSLVQKSGIKFAVGHVYRFVPQFVTVKRMAEKGRLGKIFHLESDYLQDMRELYRTSPRRRTDKSWNSWIAGGSHVVDLARWIGGDIEQIMMYANKGEEDPDCGPVDDNHLSIMKFKNGSTCKVWEVRPIKMAPDFTINLNVYGSRGTALSCFHRNEVRFFSLDEGEKQADFASLYTEKIEGIPIKLELKDFISSIKNDHPPVSGVVSGARTVAALAAGVASQKKGLPVEVEDVE
ncbi:MAG: Gfo/Idh/MocA family protein [Spirochaetota bacterium]